MKAIKLAIVLFLGLYFNNVSAQTAEIGIKAPNFVRPLVERWIAEYTKTTQDVSLKLVSGKAEEDGNLINFVVSDSNNEPETVPVGRYAILPVTLKSSEAAKILSNKKLNAKRIKELFFVDNSFEEVKKQKDIDKLHVYTGNSRQSAVHAFAKYFGKDAADSKGKKISGDDSFLNVAISKDPLGVTINSLSNIYDLKTRRVKSELSILPIDAGKEVGESFASLDDVISVLEKQNVEGVPVAKVSMSFDRNNLEAGRFISWILTNGREYIHEYGLLDLKNADLKASLAFIGGGQTDVAQK